MQTACAVVLPIVALVGACGLRYEGTQVASEPPAAPQIVDAVLQTQTKTPRADARVQDPKKTAARAAAWWKALADGDRRTVVSLLATEPDLLRARDEEGDTCLHIVAREDNTDLLELLVKKGVDIDSKGRLQGTPLGTSLAHNKPKAAEWLLAKGADVRMGDSNGKTPLLHASTWGHTKIITTLLQKGADLTVVDTAGDQPIHSAARNGRKDAVALLLAKGADVNARGCGGETPLHCAASRNKAEVIKLLLANRADKTITTRDSKKTPLMIAEKEKYAESAAALK
ncbi:MAG TPA: ankyrin repeat domain-containing protein [Planctomycetota bacterium]|nr:ankyrin repeat domain-containing protein [Planctomycetota bacterium]